jgi:2-oxoglutarate ferredoxin oxidoreductase subunit delta
MLGRKKLIIEEKWCKGCGICAAFCPKGVLEVRNETVRVKDAAACVFCGLCEQRCPDYAIYLVNVEE